MTSSPRRLADAVGLVRAASRPETLLAAAQDAWPAAVGERIAREAEPVRERDGTLTVSCRAATWAQELDLIQAELLSALNSALAPPGLRRLRFVVGPDRDDDRV